MKIDQNLQKYKEKFYKKNDKISNTTPIKFIFLNTMLYKLH